MVRWRRLSELLTVFLFSMGLLAQTEPHPALAWSSISGSEAHTVYPLDAHPAAVFDPSGALYQVFLNSTTAVPAVRKIASDGKTFVYSLDLPFLAKISGIASGRDGALYVGGEYACAPPARCPAPTALFGISAPATGSVAVAKISPSGDRLEYFDLFPAATGLRLAVDPTGAAYIAGKEAQRCVWPISSGAYQTQCDSDPRLFVTKLAAHGAALAYSTFVGCFVQGMRGVGVDSAGNVYVHADGTAPSPPETTVSCP